MLTKASIALAMIVAISSATLAADNGGPSAPSGVESTFSNMVETQRIRACAVSPIPNCDGHFDMPARLGERLDAMEECASAIEKAGDHKTALEMRRQILGYAVTLDEWLDSIILHHRKDG